MTDHDEHQHPRQVWVVYQLPTPPALPVPSILWTLAVPMDDTTPCPQCRRLGTKGPCQGATAHAYAQHARLSMRKGFLPLEVDLFELPPHVSVEACATHLYALLVKRAKGNPRTGTGASGDLT